MECSDERYGYCRIFPPTREKEEFIGLLREALKDTRAYDGCESVETFVAHGDTSVVLIEY